MPGGTVPGNTCEFRIMLSIRVLSMVQTSTHREKSEPILRPWQSHKACILFTSFGWNEIILNCLCQIIKRKREKSIYWDNLSAKVILHNGLSIWHESIKRNIIAMVTRCSNFIAIPSQHKENQQNLQDL